MRLGHPNINVMKSMLNHELSIPSGSIFCDACHIGKSKHQHYSSSTTVTSKPLELVHSDVWGPSPNLSKDGFRYYVHFIDDYSNFTWIFPLKLKSEVHDIFLNFQKLVERKFETKIKALQSDWGGEYRSLAPILTSSGIHFRHPCPHTHPQNGKSERKHRHITEMGLTLLSQASMPLNYWWEAFSTSTFLINHLSTPTLGHKSPIEVLLNIKPNLSFLKVFGCSCFPHLRAYNNHKMDFRSIKCVFLGYNPNHKGYKCLHPSGRIYIAQSVTFNESDFPFAAGFSTTAISDSASHTHTPQHNHWLPYFSSNVQDNGHDQPATDTSSSSPLLAASPLSSSPASSNSPASSSADLPSQTTSNIQPPIITPPIPPTHHMITRSKLGIFKPKTYLASILRNPNIAAYLTSTPDSVQQALAIPAWKQAMNDEFNALMQNKTWELIPRQPSMHVVDNKWIFRLKYNADGSVQRHRARLVAKGFQQQLALISLKHSARLSNHPPLELFSL